VWGPRPGPDSPAPQSLRQGYQEFKASLSYMTRSCLKKKKKKKTTGLRNITETMEEIIVPKAET
jgi:hypothetical protein